jgi:hypothetical protein
MTPTTRNRTHDFTPRSPPPTSRSCARRPARA